MSEDHSEEKVLFETDEEKKRGQDTLATEEEKTHGQDARATVVPVVEAIRYRKRAQLAEKKAAELEQELKENKKQIGELSRKLDDIASEQKMIAKLNAAGVFDIEAALALAKKRMEQQGETEPEKVIEQLQKEKGYLFSNPGSGSAGTKTAGVTDKSGSRVSVLERTAKKAAIGGRRSDLLEYLRMRRQVKR